MTNRSPAILLMAVAAFVMFGIPIIIALQDTGTDRADSPAVSSQARTTAPSSSDCTLASGEPLLPVPDDLSGFVGDDAQCTGVVVQSVVDDDGFWVGTSQSDRVYVEYGGDVGETEEGSSFVPAVGDRVDLSGPIRPAPQNPGRTLRLRQADNDLVRRQGAYVNADTAEAAS